MSLFLAKMFSKLFVRVAKNSSPDANCRHIFSSGRRPNILTTKSCSIISSRKIFRKSLPVIWTTKKKTFPVISSQEFLKHSDDPTTTVHLNSQNRHREVSRRFVCWWYLYNNAVHSPHAANGFISKYFVLNKIRMFWIKGRVLIHTFL